jgi:hypothetical protein
MEKLMDIDKLKAALDPWVRVSTWHTSHPLDEARFHRALASAFGSLGTPIEAEAFRNAMMQLAGTHHPGFDPTYLRDHVEEMAQRAEQISCFVHDTNGA